MTPPADVMGRLANVAWEAVSRGQLIDPTMPVAMVYQHAMAAARDAMLRELGGMVDSDVLEAAWEAAYEARAGAAYMESGIRPRPGAEKRMGIAGLRAAAGLLLAPSLAEIARLRHENARLKDLHIDEAEAEIARLRDQLHLRQEGWRRHGYPISSACSECGTAWGSQTLDGADDGCPRCEGAALRQRAEAAEQRVGELEAAPRFTVDGRLKRTPEGCVNFPSATPPLPYAEALDAAEALNRHRPDCHYWVRHEPVTRPASGGGETP